MASNPTIPEIVLNPAVQPIAETQAVLAGVLATSIYNAGNIGDQFTHTVQVSTEPEGLYSQPLTPLSTSPIGQFPLAVAPQAAANPSTAAVNSSAALQELNNTLGALGLNPQNINTIDSIASLVNNFNPAAFLGLAYELKAQELTTPAATAAAPIGSLSGATNPTGSGSAANTSNTANNNLALQDLNASLETIGLNSVDISKIDGIASLINNFDPAAFTVLALQLKAQEGVSPIGAITSTAGQTQSAAA